MFRSKIPLGILAIVAIVVNAPTAKAQSTYSWNLDAAGTWDTATSNWLLTGAPANWANGANTASFGSVITANRAIAIGTGGVTAGQLSFSNTGAFTYALGTTGNNITLNNGGSDAVITINRDVVGTANSGSATGGHTVTNSNITFFNNLNIVNNGAFGTTSLGLNSTIDRNTAGGQVVFSGQGTTALGALGTITANITGGVVMNGTGTVTLGSPTNAFTGNVTINSGVLGINSNDLMLGALTNSVNINTGGTFRFFSGITSARAFNVSGVATIDNSSANTTILSGNTATSGLVGSGTVRLTMSNGATAGITSIEGNQTGFTGQMVVGQSGLELSGALVAQRLLSTTNTATLRLQNAGILANTTGLTFNNAGGLLIVNGTTAPAQNLPDRISNSAPITSNSGRLQFQGPDAVASGETLGNITGTGMTTVTIGSATTNDGFQTIALGTLSNTALDRPTYYFRGPIGGAVPSATVSNVTVSGGLTPVFVPTGDGTTGPTSGAGTGTLTGIVPFIGASTSNTSSDPRSFATYDANGLRVLLQTDTNFFAQVGAAGVMPDFANINVTGTPADIIGTKIINSLAVNSGVTIGGAGTLRIHSGAIATFNSFTFNGPTIDFGTATGYFHSGFAMTIAGTSSLTGSGGFVTGSLGTSTSYRVNFQNTVANTFTGGLYINGNVQVTFRDNNQLGQIGGGLNAGDITLGGGQLLYIPTAAGSQTLADGGTNRAIRVNASNGTIGVGLAASTLTIPGLISGPGQMQFGGGTTTAATGIVELTGGVANTYTGGTVVSTGTLRIGNVNQLGTGAVMMNGGTLQASAGLTFANAPIMIASSTIDTQANNIALNGGLNGSGGTLGTSATSHILTKNGSGTLTITGTGNYAGGITLGNTGGALTFNGNGRQPELGPVSLGLSTALNIDNSSTNIADRTGRTTNLTLTNSAGAAAGGATVNLTTNASGSTFTFGALAVSGGTATNLNTSIINLVDGTAGNNTITFNSLTAVATNNVLNIVGTTNFGRDTIGGTRIFFLTPPTLTGGAIANVNFTGFGGSGAASYDSVLGVILLQTTTGTFIDNITNVGAGSITPTGTAFTTNGATTANLGATIKSLTIAGHTVTMVPNVNAPQAGNLNAPATSLVLTGGGLTSNTAASTITSASATTIQFGAVNANIAAATDLTIAANVTLAGTNGLTKSGAGIFNVNGPLSITGLYTVSAGTVNFNSSAVVTGLTGSAATVAIPSGQSLAFTGAATTTYSGIVDGPGAISTQAGFTGLQVLSGANTITGAVTVNGGTLAAGSAGGLGAAGNTAPFSVASGATLGFQGGVTYTANNPTSIAGIGATGRTGAIDNISGTNTYAAPITVASGTTIGATAGVLTLSGGLTGTNANLTANGAGNVLLTTAAMNLGNGTLTKTGTGVFGLPNFTNTLGNSTATGGLIRASADNNFGATTNSLLLNGGGFQYGDAAFAFDNARSVTLGAAGGTIDTNALSPTFAYNLTGPGNLTKSGAGTLTVNVVQNYAGNTTISGGVLTLGIANALPQNLLTIGNIAASNIDTQLNLGGFNQTVSGLTITARGSASVSAVTGAGILTVNGPISYVDNTAAPGNAFQGNINASVTAIDLGGAIRNITVAGQNNGQNPGDFTINTVIQNGGINYTGNISSTNSVATGTLLNAASANTYALGTTVNAGTLTVASTTTLGTGGGLTMNQTGTVVSSVGLNSAQTLTSLATGTINASASTTLTLTGATTILTVNQTTNTTFGGVVSGTGGLTKSGPGILTLGGVNTYGAATTVDGGTLRVGAAGVGSTAAGSAVTVNTGGLIGGSGIINGALTINGGGGVAPGNSIGTLTVNNNVTINGNPSPTTTQWNVELNGVAANTVATADDTNVDRLVLTGAANNLNFVTSSTNRITINVTQLGGAFTIGSPVSYRIATAVAGSNIQSNAGAFDGSHYDFTATGFAFSGTPTLLVDSNHLVLTFTPVPEPTTMIGLGLLTVAGAGWVRRRRQAVVA